jgi:hypothetical protein
MSLDNYCYGSYISSIRSEKFKLVYNSSEKLTFEHRCILGEVKPV